MFLVAIRFTHYAPKDSEEGIKEYVISDSFEKVLEYIEKTYYGVFGEEDDEGSVCPSKEWWDAHPDAKREADQLGFKVDEYGFGLGLGDVVGPYRDIVIWWGGNDFGDVEDAYYGVTQYHWETQRISSENAATLVGLGIAKIV
jgi:hypothetical protein